MLYLAVNLIHQLSSFVKLALWHLCLYALTFRYTMVFCHFCKKHYQSSFVWKLEYFSLKGNITLWLQNNYLITECRGRAVQCVRFKFLWHQNMGSNLGLAWQRLEHTNRNIEKTLWSPHGSPWTTFSLSDSWETSCLILVLPWTIISLSDSRDTSCAIRFFSEPVTSLSDSWDKHTVLPQTETIWQGSNH